MDEAERMMAALAEAGFPVSLVQRPDGKWEVNISVEGSPNNLTHFAAATTREAAVEEAARTILPSVLVGLVSGYLLRQVRDRIQTPLLQGTSSLTFGQLTDLEHFGGFGFQVRFRREPDDSYSWGVFAEDGTPFAAGVANDLDGAKLDAIERLLPPSSESRPA